MVEKVDGAEETVRKLKAIGVVVGVVSSKRRPMVDKGLRATGLEGLMDVIITPEDTEKHKPDGEPVIKACQLVGVNPENALMVGDSHFDILCGKNAESKTCAVKYTMLPIDELLKCKPDYVIDNLRELIGIVNNENKNNYLKK
jgi:pyrophosphatase PpaX